MDEVPKASENESDLSSKEEHHFHFRFHGSPKRALECFIQCACDMMFGNEHDGSYEIPLTTLLKPYREEN